MLGSGLLGLSCFPAVSPRFQEMVVDCPRTFGYGPSCRCFLVSAVLPSILPGVRLWGLGREAERRREGSLDG